MNYAEISKLKKLAKFVSIVMNHFNQLRVTQVTWHLLQSLLLPLEVGEQLPVQMGRTFIHMFY